MTDKVAYVSRFPIRSTLILSTEECTSSLKFTRTSPSTVSPATLGD